MMERLSILIVEDDDIVATNLAAMAEDRHCDVVGPVATVSQALMSIERAPVDAAVLDANLRDRDVTPVAMALIEKGIPFVIHTGVGLPAELQSVFPHVSVIMKPADPDAVVARLLAQLATLHELPDRAASPVDAGAGEDHRSRQVARIGAALFEQFGDKAIVLARRQAADASGDVLASWSEIIRDLAARAARRHEQAPR